MTPIEFSPWLYIPMCFMAGWALGGWITFWCTFFVKRSLRRMKHETTRSICDWGLETFGPVRAPAVYISRALEEFAELVGELDPGDEMWAGSGFDHICLSLKKFAQEIKQYSVPNGKESAVCEESADVRIVLQHLHGALGHDMADDEARKMAINRERKWPPPNGEGVAYHLDEQDRAEDETYE